MRRLVRSSSSSPMADLHVLDRIPLPEPLIFHRCFRHDGRRAVAVEEGSGRLWLLEIDPGLHVVDFHPLPVGVPGGPDGEMRIEHLSGSHALDRLLVLTAGSPPRVYALPSADLVAEPRPIPGRSACLSPSGRWLISLDEDQGWTMDLDDGMPWWRETDVFHRLDVPEEGRGGEDRIEREFLDHVDGVATHTWNGEPGALGDDRERFWVAAGCYGFVLTHLVETGPAGRNVRRVEGRTRLFGGLVYDPTELVRPFGQRHVFVRHGFGAGLAALDPASGERHDCRVGADRNPYGYFSAAVPCGGAPLAWVRTRDGCFLWDLGEHLLHPMPEVRPVLALYPDALLALEDGELVWRGI